MANYPSSFAGYNVSRMAYKAEELRSALKDYDFSYGCFLYPTEINAANYDATKANQYDEQTLNSNNKSPINRPYGDDFVEQLKEFILAFCNQNQMQLCLHTVFFPLDCALRSLDVLSLKAILNFMTASLNVMPDLLKIEKRNKRYFIDFVKQIKQWAENVYILIKEGVILKKVGFLELVKTRFELPELRDRYNLNAAILLLKN